MKKGKKKKKTKKKTPRWRRAEHEPPKASYFSSELRTAQLRCSFVSEWIAWSCPDGLCCTTLTKKPLSLLPHDAPFLPAFLTTVSTMQTRLHVRGGGGGGGGGRRDKQRFALWDMWFNVSGQMLRYVAVLFTDMMWCENETKRKRNFHVFLKVSVSTTAYVK